MRHKLISDFLSFVEEMQNVNVPMFVLVQVNDLEDSRNLKNFQSDTWTLKHRDSILTKGNISVKFMVITSEKDALMYACGGQYNIVCFSEKLTGRLKGMLTSRLRREPWKAFEYSQDTVKMYDHNDVYAVAEKFKYQRNKELWT